MVKAIKVIIAEKISARGYSQVEIRCPSTMGNMQLKYDSYLSYKITNYWCKL
jgi:hypothetical protein